MSSLVSFCVFFFNHANRNFAGFVTWLAWRTTYLNEQVSWKNRMLLAGDWTRVHLFGRDVSRFWSHTNVTKTPITTRLMFYLWLYVFSQKEAIFTYWNIFMRMVALGMKMHVSMSMEHCIERPDTQRHFETLVWLRRNGCFWNEHQCSDVLRQRSYRKQSWPVSKVAQYNTTQSSLELWGIAVFPLCMI
jgi:hypothetical protein